MQKHLLQQYYDNYFPYEEIFNWVSAFHEPVEMLKREFSYIIGQDDTEEEYCIRNIGYKTVDEFKNDVKKSVPLRIDIGAFFDGPVSNNKNKVKDLAPNPIEREFVIDIDMTDYDHIRTCCKGKKLCERCWEYIKAAYDVLKKILEDAFGFKYILWVYSGRRGVHAWVCDKEARQMNKKLRSSVTDFLNFTVSSDKVNYMVKKELIDRDTPYPLLMSAYEILKKKRDFLLFDQKILENENILDQLIAVLERLAGKTLQFFKDEIFKIKDQQKRYEYLVSILNTAKVRTEKEEANKIELSDDIILQRIEKLKEKFDVEFILGCLYPKIDSHFNENFITNIRHEKL